MCLLFEAVETCRTQPLVSEGWIMQESENKSVLMFLWQKPFTHSESKLGNDDIILTEIPVLHGDLITILSPTHNSFFNGGP